MRNHWTLTWALMFAAVSPSFSQVTKLAERLPSYYVQDPFNYQTIPYIVGAQVLQDTIPIGEYHPARYDSQLLTRLYRVRAKVENALQGDVKVGQIIDIYFFRDTRNLGSSGSAMSFPVGTRQIFFLQKDYGEFRTITDQFSNICAVQILSGAHPNFVRSSRLVAEDIQTLLLTRGTDVSDEEMQNALKHSDLYRIFGDKTLIRKLQELTQIETPPVAQTACSRLEKLDAPCPPKPTKK